MKNKAYSRSATYIFTCSSESTCILATHQGTDQINVSMSTDDFVFITVDKFNLLTRCTSILLINCLAAKCKMKKIKQVKFHVLEAL